MSTLRADGLCLSLLLLAGACMPSAKRPVQPGPLDGRIGSYWNDVDLDTAETGWREQRIVDFLYLMEHADSATRHTGWQRLHAALDSSLDRTVVDYLGESGSPLYAPGLLDEYLVSLVGALPATDAGHIRAAYLLRNIRKNRPGDIVANLPLLAVADSSVPTALHSVLHTLPGNTADVLILFYDPDCDTCDSLISDLAQSVAATPVIAVSVAGTDKSLPAGWRSFRAAGSEVLDSLFYLPSLPALYYVDPASLRVTRRG